MRRLAYAIVPLLMCACNRESVAPDSNPTPSFSATTEWLRYSESWEWLETVPCRGNTEFRVHGDVDVSWHLVSSSGGRFQFQLMILPRQPFVMEELSTGIVFELRPNNVNIVHDVEGSGKGGTWWVRQKWTFEAPNGDKITRSFDILVKWDANGELVVYRERALEFKCVFK